MAKQQLESPSSFPPLPASSSVRQRYEKKQLSSLEDKAPSSSIFRGAIFVISKLTISHISSSSSSSLQHANHILTINEAETETLITANGGVMLTSAVIDALRKDMIRDPSTCSDRTCYVLSVGGAGAGGNYRQQSSAACYLHPLLQDLEGTGITNVVAVTPIWLKTCLKEQWECLPQNQSLLFQPPPWPIQTMDHKHKPSQMKVAVTGFVGIERGAIVETLRALGVEYTESMRSSNTHLICKEPSGAKFERAKEWGLHVVSVDWLYHVMQFGYGGEEQQNKEHGCEARFSMSQETKAAAAALMNVPIIPEGRKYNSSSTTPLPEKRNRDMSPPEEKSQTLDLRATSEADERIRSALKILEGPRPDLHDKQKQKGRRTIIMGGEIRSRRKRRMMVPTWDKQSSSSSAKVTQDLPTTEPSNNKTDNNCEDDIEMGENISDESENDDDNDDDEEEEEQQTPNFKVCRHRRLLRGGSIDSGVGGVEDRSMESQIVWYGERTQQ